MTEQYTFEDVCGITSNTIEHEYVKITFNIWDKNYQRANEGYYHCTLEIPESMQSYFRDYFESKNFRIENLGFCKTDHRSLYVCISWSHR